MEQVSWLVVLQVLSDKEAIVHALISQKVHLHHIALLICSLRLRIHYIYEEVTMYVSVDESLHGLIEHLQHAVHCTSNKMLQIHRRDATKLSLN